ncbi:hypothetical protein AAA799O18_00746, partial [Marine Group I thaumarchaeote SCGC AAA799-O18]
RGSGVYGHLKELRQLDFIKNQNIFLMLFVMDMADA